MPGLCRDQLSRLCGGVLNTVLVVPVILVMISAGVEAAAQDRNISGTYSWHGYICLDIRDAGADWYSNAC